MDYFALYNLPEAFLPDEAALRAAYYRLSRESHPDFFATQPADEQARALDRATLNTDAYRTLSDYDRRLEYILRRHGLLVEGQTPELPASFLGEMMEINEQLMELEADPDPEAVAKARAAVEELARDLEAGIRPTLEAYPALPEGERAAALRRVLDYYLRRRYVLRIHQQMAKFADRSA